MIWLLILAAAYWLVVSYLCYSTLKKTFRKYRNVLRISTPEKYNAFLRMDFGKWDEKTLLTRAFTVFPLRITGLASFMIIYGMLSALHRNLRLPAIIVKIFRRYYGSFVMRIWLNIQEEFDPSEQIDTPIVVSNHSTWIDIMYFGTCLKTIMAYVAKKEIAEMPFVSSVATFLQCILVDRSSEAARNKVKQDILDRVQNYKKNPAQFYPICIFPEGTVSNGRSIMEFKNGAFEALSPITLFSLKYESKEFHMGDNETSALENYLLSVCANSGLRIKKEKIVPKEGETVQCYRERCRKRVAEMWGFKIYDVSFKQYFEYEKMYKDKLKQVKQNNG